MEERMLLRKSLDQLECISVRLEKLNSMITSIALGMEHELMEKQSIACVESIGYCVSDIQRIALEGLRQIKEGIDIAELK